LKDSKYKKAVSKIPYESKVVEERPKIEEYRSAGIPSNVSQIRKVLSNEQIPAVSPTPKKSIGLSQKQGHDSG